MSGDPPPPPTLSEAEIQRVHRLVRQHLPSEYDREFIADTIILSAWLNGLTSVSHGYIRHKCISAWRTQTRERRRNQETVYEPPKSRSEHTEETVDRRILIEELVIGLSPLERRLVWMKFYDDQTLAEMTENLSLRREVIQQALKVALYKMRIQLT